MEHHREENQQANFLLPGSLLAELRKRVPARQRSAVVAEALRNELRRRQFREALEYSFGAWSDKNYPELREGSTEYVRKLRRSDRVERLHRR